MANHMHVIFKLLTSKTKKMSLKQKDKNDASYLRQFKLTVGVSSETLEVIKITYHFLNVGKALNPK